MSPQDRPTILNLRSPAISWSDYDVWMERYTVTMAVLQIQIHPMRSKNRSRSNLKFITADGVKYKISSLSMYSRPLATCVWLTLAGFFAAVVILVVISSTKTQVGSRAKIVRWSGFWIDGAVVDHVPDVPRAHASIKRVEQILFGALALVFLLNNHYKAALSVDYIAGNELVPLWYRIDQLLNFNQFICSSYVHYMQRNGMRLDPLTEECQQKRISILRSLNRRLKYFPIKQLVSYVRNNLTKPNTALLTAEAGFGSV